MVLSEASVMGPFPLDAAADPGQTKKWSVCMPAYYSGILFGPGSRNKPWSQNLNWLCSKVTFDLLALFISFLILAMATVGLKAGFWCSKTCSKTWNSKSWPSESLKQPQFMNACI